MLDKKSSYVIMFASITLSLLEAQTLKINKLQPNHIASYNRSSKRGRMSHTCLTLNKYDAVRKSRVALLSKNKETSAKKRIVNNIGASFIKIIKTDKVSRVMFTVLVVHSLIQLTIFMFIMGRRVRYLYNPGLLRSLSKKLTSKPWILNMLFKLAVFLVTVKLKRFQEAQKAAAIQDKLEAKFAEQATIHTGIFIYARKEPFPANNRLERNIDDTITWCVKFLWSHTIGVGWLNSVEQPQLEEELEEGAAMEAIDILRNQIE